nr:unnamed protein product [Callosobruchus analis]
MAAWKSIVLVIICCCAAQVVSADFCSGEKGIENFNLTAFQGVWYFSYKYGSRIPVWFGNAYMHVYTVPLETDYENYLTEFFCVRGQMAEGYIRTRSKNPSPEILKKAKEAAKQRVHEVQIEPWIDLGCSNTDL